MTVDEVKTAADLLRSQIEQMVFKLETESHCVVSNLSIERYTIGGKPTIAMNVKLFHSGR